MIISNNVSMLVITKFKLELSSHLRLRTITKGSLVANVTVYTEIVMDRWIDFR